MATNCGQGLAATRRSSEVRRTEPSRSQLTRNAAGRLIYFQDSGCLHHRRLLLALSEALGALAIDVNARELFAVVVIHRDLPVTVFAAAVSVKPAGFASLGLLSHCLSAP